MTAQSEAVDGGEIRHALRAVILLAGRVGRNPFADGVQRSPLDLPIGGDGPTLMDVWARHFSQLALELEIERLRVIVAVDREGVPPSRTDSGFANVAFEVAYDPVEYRGTAGVVKDLTRGFRDEDRILVAKVRQIQREPLCDVFDALSRVEEGVSIVPRGVGEHAGAFLLRCARLREVSDVGFVDLKEQAIPAARGGPPLRVALRPHGSALPTRTMEEYLSALRTIHVRGAWGGPEPETESPFAETWRSAFAIVERGAEVAADAILQDSVVLAGGRVEKGAVVARSVVCRGGVVTRGRSAVDRLVTD